MKKIILLAFLLISYLSNGQNFKQILNEFDLENQKCLDKGNNMFNCSKKYLIQSDSILNVVYRFVRKELTGSEKKSLRKEQVIWNKEKEKTFKEINKQNTGLVGGLDDLMIKNQKMSDYINKRTKYLIDYSPNKVSSSIPENITDFVPSKFKLFEKKCGDLNKDGLEDCVLIIKGTNKSRIVDVEFRGILDRNRRGIIVLINQGKGIYKPILKNYECFSSENEDGGVYFPPELSIDIANNKLFIHYSHGRYGFWKYKFRIKESDFELIGYDSTYGGAVIRSKTSINFLTKKKLYQFNKNKNDEGGNEILKDTWSEIKLSKTILLSKIMNFDELDIN